MKKYPKINRENIDFTSDTEVCNIGYQEGTLKDGRSYRMEVWESYGVLNATVFISIIDFENKTESDIKKYLVENDLIEIIEDKIYITELEDSNDNSFLSINVPIKDHEKELNRYLVSLKDYLF